MSYIPSFTSYTSYIWWPTTLTHLEFIKELPRYKQNRITKIKISIKYSNLYSVRHTQLIGCLRVDRLTVVQSAINITFSKQVTILFTEKSDKFIFLCSYRNKTRIVARSATFFGFCLELEH